MSWSAISTHFFNTSKDSDSTTSLGSLFQWLTTLSLKKFFWISNLILPWCNLRPFRRSNAFVTSVSFQVPCQNSQSKLNKRDTLWCRHLFPQTKESSGNGNRFHSLPNWIRYYTVKASIFRTGSWITLRTTELFSWIVSSTSIITTLHMARVFYKQNEGTSKCRYNCIIVS